MTPKRYVINTIGHLMQTFVTKYMRKSYWLTGTTVNGPVMGKTASKVTFIQKNVP